MFTTKRIVKVDSSKLIEDGQMVYVSPDSYETTDSGKRMAVFIRPDALLVAEDADFETEESRQAFNDKCMAIYGLSFVEILNGQGLPLEATRVVIDEIKIKTGKAAKAAAAALNQAAANLAKKLNISLDEATKMLTGE